MGGGEEGKGTKSVEGREGGRKEVGYRGGRDNRKGTGHTLCTQTHKMSLFPQDQYKQECL